MELEKYVIMRDLTLEKRRAGPAFPQSGAAFGPSLSRMQLPGLAPTLDIEPEIEMTVERLGTQERREIHADPSALSAQLIPTQLVRAIADPVLLADATSADILDGNGSTWGVNAVAADVSSESGTGVEVAVLDTGIKNDHPAFTGVDLAQKDFTGDGNGDGNGHGTHCAGTIFGRNVEGIRIGVAPGITRAHIGKVLNSEGGGDSEMLFNAMNWAALEQKAQVISMSLGFDIPGYVDGLVNSGWPVTLAASRGLEAYRANLLMFEALMDTIDAFAAFGGGSVIVAAAGNESRRDIDPNFEVSASMPAVASDVLSTGALRQDSSGLSVADFSNTNPIISAPGQEVLSAWINDGLVSLNGTSMAAPHVAGVTALWWEKLRKQPVPATARTVTAKVLATASTFGFLSGVDILDRGVGISKSPTT